MLHQGTKTYYESSLEGKKQNRTGSNLSDFSMVETEREHSQTRKAEEEGMSAWFSQEAVGVRKGVRDSPVQSNCKKGKKEETHCRNSQRL